MKSVLISIRPQWCEKIASGEKTIEVRKTAPKETPFKAYIYCTKSDKYLLDSDCDGSMFCWDKKSHHYPFKFEKDFNELFNGKVIGEFICDKVDKYTFSHYEAEYRVTHVEQKAMCLNQPELIRYGKGKTLYGWHISDLKIYDKPKELSEFYKCNFNSMNGTEVCGNYHCKYYQDSGSYMIPPSCAKLGNRVTRPPQSYMFVEEVGQ